MKIDLLECQIGDKVKRRNGEICVIDKIDFSAPSHSMYYIVGNYINIYHSKTGVTSIDVPEFDVIEIMKDDKLAKLKEKHAELGKEIQRLEEPEWEIDNKSASNFELPGITCPIIKDRFLMDANYIYELAQHTNSKFKEKNRHEILFDLDEEEWVPVGCSYYNSIARIFTSYESAELACEILNKKEFRLSK